MPASIGIAGSFQKQPSSGALRATQPNMGLIERERQALSQIVHGVPLKDVLDELLRATEQQSDHAMLTSILLVGSDGQHLTHGAAPSLPAPYNEAIDGIPVGEGIGSCGTAACRGVPVYVDDIASDPLWKDFRDLALKHGLRACWSTPIKAADGGVLGTFAIYYGDVRSPTAGDIETISFITQTVALAIERHRSDQQLRDNQEHLRRANAELAQANDRMAERVLTVEEEAQRTAALLELGDRLRETDTIPDTISLASHILGRELQVQRVGYATIDRTGGTFTVERDWTADGISSLVGEHPLVGVTNTLDRLSLDESMAIANVPAAHWLGDDRDAYSQFGARALINVPLVIRQQLVGVLFVHSGQSRVWSKGEIALAHGVADRAYATIAQLEAEAERNILNLELSHRMKNMLAMVQAIAVQTLKNVDDRNAVDALDKRLMALGTAHDVLLQDHWASAAVGGVVQRVLGMLGIADRVQVSGPTVSFGPRAALALSLLLHELATNAIKYGALSADCGHVNLDWCIDGIGLDATFKMTWKESGGPAAVEPPKKGFGSKLIKMGLLGTGGTTTRYLPTGFEADFHVSLDRANAE
jgi:two-component sensor histidine kinase